MTSPIYAIGEPDVPRLRSLLAAYETGRLNPAPEERLFAQYPQWTRVAKALTKIPAIVGNRPGTGRAELFYLNDSGTLVTWLTQDTVTAYNIFCDDVLAGEWILLNREPLSGNWFTIQTSCISSGGSTSTSHSGCCPNLPDTLTITLYNAGFCPCIDGSVITIFFNSQLDYPAPPFPHISGWYGCLTPNPCNAVMNSPCGDQQAGDNESICFKLFCLGNRQSCQDFQLWATLPNGVWAELPFNFNCQCSPLYLEYDTDNFIAKVTQ